jgi:hypothetical protein
VIESGKGGHGLRVNFVNNGTVERQGDQIDEEAFHCDISDDALEAAASPDRVSDGRLMLTYACPYVAD